MAEVYTLNTAFVVLVIYLLLRWEAARPSARDLLLAAFVYGLSLTHHRMILIFPPALALFLWLTDRKVFTNAGLLLKTVRDVFALPEGTARIDIGMHHPEGEGIAPYGEIISVEFDSA